MSFVSFLPMIAILIFQWVNQFTAKTGKKEIEFNFNLKNVDGKRVSLNDYPHAKGFIIIFTCNHCPFAKLYPPRFNAMNLKYMPLGVPLIAISSTDTITYEEDGYLEMVRKAKSEKFNFPYLFDDLQQVAKNYNAQKTPHAYVIWKEKGQWEVKYDGAIDDNGAQPEKVTMPYVALAVDNLLNKKPVNIKSSKSIGCQIYFRGEGEKMEK
jgi:peroxiredoxin